MVYVCSNLKYFLRYFLKCCLIVDWRVDIYICIILNKLNKDLLFYFLIDFLIKKK